MWSLCEIFSLYLNSTIYNGQNHKDDHEENDNEEEDRNGPVEKEGFIKNAESAASGGRGQASLHHLICGAFLPYWADTQEGTFVCAKKESMLVWLFRTHLF